MWNCIGTFVLTQINLSNFVLKLDETVHERMLAGKREAKLFRRTIKKSKMFARFRYSNSMFTANQAG